MKKYAINLPHKIKRHIGGIKEPPQFKVIEITMHINEDPNQTNGHTEPPAPNAQNAQNQPPEDAPEQTDNAAQPADQKDQTASKKSRLARLTNIFKPAAIGAIAGAATKGLAVAAGTATIGPVFALAAAGVFLGLNVFNDIRKRKEDETKRDILKKNYKKYLFKTVAAGTGAVVGFMGADTILSAFNDAPDILDTTGIENIPDDIKEQIITDSQEPPAPDPVDVSTQQTSDTMANTDTPVIDTVETTPDASMTAEPDIEPPAEPVLDNDTPQSIAPEAQTETEAQTIAETKTDTMAAVQPDAQLDAQPEPQAEQQSEQNPEPQIIIPDDIFARLELLLEQDGLSEQAQSIIEAALKGQDWAIRDAGLGLINGQYGFDHLGDMAGKLDVNAWGTDLLRDAVASGDAKAQMDMAYYLYTGVNEAVTIDQDAALEIIRAQDSIWYNGDELLTEIRLQDAKDDFLSQMPEGTNIHDYTVEINPDGGYHFEPREIAMDQDQRDALSNAGLDPDTCTLRERGAQELIWDNCEPALN